MPGLGLGLGLGMELRFRVRVLGVRGVLGLGRHI